MVRAAIAVVVIAACGGGGGNGGPDGRGGDAAANADAAPALANRDRLLATYLAYLQTQDTPQSNGLLGADLPDVCALWTALDPSSRETFLTLTARLDGSLLIDRTSMLDHATRLYRLTGGQGATGSDPGSCGGGEYNRMVVAIDPALHDVLVAANVHQGAPDGNGQVDLEDIPQGGFWRDSHDAGGTHAPFDLSDETEGGAPRGQVQFFVDTSSAAATSALGRLDLEGLVEPYAMEMDHDYDCTHNSNPSCTYVLYGPFCAPMTSLPGTEIYVASYGDYGPSWTPTGCN